MMRDKIEAICDALGYAMQEPAHECHAEIFLHELERGGFFVVPRDPTEKMLDAAREWSVKKYGIGVGNDSATGCYQSMIYAAKETQK